VQQINIIKAGFFYYKVLSFISVIIGARSSVVVEALYHKPEVRGLENVNFFQYPKPFILTMDMAFTEFSTRSRKVIFLVSKERPAHEADNLTAIC
jgi:hypothetical protein